MPTLLLLEQHLPVLDRRGSSVGRGVSLADDEAAALRAQVDELRHALELQQERANALIQVRVVSACANGTAGTHAC